MGQYDTNQDPDGRYMRLQTCRDYQVTVMICEDVSPRVLT